MMNSRMVMQGIIITFIMLCMSGTFAQMDSTTKSRISSGINGGQQIVDFFSKFGDSKVDKIFDSLEKMSGFLGAVGGLASFVFSFLSSESAELRYMKMKFAEVNMKLDRITAVLDDVKDLITYENQRAIYVTSSSKIIYGHKRLDDFFSQILNTHCTNKQECERLRARIASQFVGDFNIQQQLFTIINGATKKTSAFGDPLLQLIQKTFKCDTTKIDQFSASVVKLSFKAQQVILIYEKLTGTNESITQSLHGWLKMLYDLREQSNRIKQQCYSNIGMYMQNDIKDRKYQVGISSNIEAVSELEKFMVRKYPWLGWIIYSYKQYGGSKHCITNQEGAFWSMPAGTNNRKRNVISSFYDKNGTYNNQKYEVIAALDEIVAQYDFINVERDACQILPVIVEELKKKSVYQYVTSFNILREYENFEISAKNKATYIDKEYSLASFFTNMNGMRDKRFDRVRLIIVLSSEEIASKANCPLQCHNRGVCMKLPYSSTANCQCKPNYQGKDCKNHTKANLAETVDAMLAVTLKLPALSDIAYDISDLRQYLGVRIGSAQAAISELEKTFTLAFNALSLKLTQQFQWTNLVTQYSDAIKWIRYYSYRFQYLSQQYEDSMDREGKKLAAAVLAPDAIQKWLYEINSLILGREATPLINHAPLMHIFINKYSSLACTSKYKTAVNNAWRQMIILQQTGYMVWVQALTFNGQSTERAKMLYRNRVANQIRRINESICDYKVQHSKTIDCVGGYYLHPNVEIENKCMDNYYVNGSLTTSCKSRRSECSKCDCNPEGSETLQCADITGRCNCTSGYYGEKCSDRDCELGDWSAWSSCSKSCDYGGVQVRTRSQRIVKEGQGKPCHGYVTSTKTCFNACCEKQLHCKPDKKCYDIPQCYCNKGGSSCIMACFSKAMHFIAQKTYCI